MPSTLKPLPPVELIASSEGTKRPRAPAASEEERKARIRESARVYRLRQEELNGSKRIKAYKKAWATKNADRAREQNKAWKARNPDKVREYRRLNAERHKEKRAEYRRGFRERHREAIRAAAREAYWRDPEVSRARDRERSARQPSDPVKAREKERRNHLAKKARRLLTASVDERQRAKEVARAFLAAIKDAVPKAWPFHDDVVGDLVVAYYAGKITVADIPRTVEKCGRRYRNEEYETLSLDVPAYEGGPNYLDLLIGDNPLEEDDDYED